MTSKEKKRKEGQQKRKEYKNRTKAENERNKRTKELKLSEGAQKFLHKDGGGRAAIALRGNIIPTVRNYGPVIVNIPDRIANSNYCALHTVQVPYALIP